MFNDTLRGSNSTATTETFYGGAGNDLIDGRGGSTLRPTTTSISRPAR